MLEHSVRPFEIVAHRGITDNAPENTLPAFEQAVELGADAIEFDIRLTSDKVPVVYHYYYLENNSSATGTIFNHTLSEINQVKVFSKNNPTAVEGHISTLGEVLQRMGGRIGLEIEIKGPEPEAPQAVGAVLADYRHLWHTIEVTARIPAFLLAVQRICPGLATNLLYPLSANWMKPDVVEFEALNLSRLANAKAVHLHPSQLTRTIVDSLHEYDIAVHAYEVNEDHALKTCIDLGIPRICTDNVAWALAIRSEISEKP